MALVIDTHVGVSSFVPFERPPQSLTLWSAIPRGLQSFLVAAEATAIKPVNDEILYQVTALLPPNFGYVFADANLSIATDFVDQFDNQMNLNFQNFYRGGDSAIGLNGNFPQPFVVISVLSDLIAMEQRAPLPTFPMIGTSGTTGIQVNMSANNPGSTATAAGVINAYLSFWQFDLEQIRKYPINSPSPVHAR